jgi:hypothetical protein
MIRFGLLVAVIAALAPRAAAEEVKYVDEGGVRYQVITQTTQRPISETQYVPHEYTTLREHYTTEYQESQRVYQVPVVEQQWVPGYQRTLNIFAPPVLSYRLMPVTRWETRSETVRVPVTKRNYVPEKQVTQVPVVNQRVATEVHTHRIAIGPATGNTPLMATRNDVGGTKLDGEPAAGSNNNVWRGGLEPTRP